MVTVNLVCMKLRNLKAVPEEIKKASDVVDSAVRTNATVVAIVGVVALVALFVAVAALTEVRNV